MTDLAVSIMTSFRDTMLEMSPYLLFGFLAAGILSVFISQQLVEKHLGGSGLWQVVKASMFGVPLPLCSCSVIPVAMSLHKHGASRGSAISFLLSTPQTGVDSIFVTYSLLGPVFAVFRPIAALLTGIVGGIFVNNLDKTGPAQTAGSSKCQDQCCCHDNKAGRLMRIVKYSFVTLPRDIGRPMLIGLVVAAFISALVPDGYFAEKLGTGIGAMIVMMLLGIPVYVCATASVPIAAALIIKGVTPGAALVFLMTGPATNAASFISIWKILGRATALTYLATVAGSALVGGLLLDYLAGGAGFAVSAKPGWMLPVPVRYAAAIILFAVLLPAAFAVKRKSKQDS